MKIYDSKDEQKAMMYAANIHPTTSLQFPHTLAIKANVMQAKTMIIARKIPSLLVIYSTPELPIVGLD